MSQSNKITLLIVFLAIVGALTISARADEPVIEDPATLLQEVQNMYDEAAIILEQALATLQDATQQLAQAELRVETARQVLAQAEFTCAQSRHSRLGLEPLNLPPARVELAPVVMEDLIYGPSREEARRAADRVYILQRSRELQSLEPAEVRMPVLDYDAIGLPTLSYEPIPNRTGATTRTNLHYSTTSRVIVATEADTSEWPDTISVQQCLDLTQQLVDEQHHLCIDD
ncbi:MAG: hypothetical protein ABIH67_05105 [Candidatus Uhrbacteria bacterium]